VLNVNLRNNTLLMLLLLFVCRLETKSRCLPHVTRSAVFVHLANVLSCEKETLMKRAKRMVLAQHDENCDGQLHCSKKVQISLSLFFSLSGIFFL